MSMLSSMCDNLRLMARLVRDYDYDVISHELRHAADTIWELRCKLTDVVDQQDEIERLEDENARLRSCLSDDAENARQIMAENANLRKAAEFEHNQLEDIMRAVDMMLEEHVAMLAENAKLREERDEFKALSELKDTQFNNVLSSVEMIKAENAKLRELVRDMFEEIEVGGFDPMVERHGKSTVYYEEDPSWRVEIRERVRELGIEVK